MTLILTDLDNSLLDFNHAFEAWLYEEGIPFKQDSLKDNYEISKMFDTPTDTMALVNDFFDSEKAGNFRSLRDAEESINLLRDNGYRFIAISACRNCPDLVYKRASNIKDVFGFEFDDVVLTGFHGCKKNELKKHNKSVWVEDHSSNAIIGSEAGHQTFLINHGYNKNDVGDFTRVADWSEISNKILKNS